MSSCFHKQLCKIKRFRDCLRLAMCYYSYKRIFFEPRCVVRLVKLYHNASAYNILRRLSHVCVAQ